METRSKMKIGEKGDEEENARGNMEIDEENRKELNFLDIMTAMKNFEENMSKKFEDQSKKLEDQSKILDKTFKEFKEELTDNITEMDKKLVNSLMAFNDMFSARINQVEEEFTSKLQEKSKICKKNLEISENRIKTEFHNIIERNLSIIQNDMEKQNEQLENNKIEMYKNAKIQNEKIEENWSTSGIINLGDNKMHFNGKIKKQHPVPFMKFLENRQKYFTSFITFKEYIRSQLTEEALLWINNKDVELNDFETFKTKFLSYFWGPSQQKVIKNELFSGKFNPNMGTSYHRYAMQIYSVAQYLDADFTEEYIVSLIIQHFDKELEDVLLLYDFKEMDKLCQFLMSQEYRLRRNFQRQNLNQYASNQNQQINNGNNYNSNRSYQRNQQHINNYHQNQNYNRGQNQNNRNAWRQGNQNERSMENRNNHQSGENRRMNNMNRSSESQEIMHEQEGNF